MSNPNCWPRWSTRYAGMAHTHTINSSPQIQLARQQIGRTSWRQNDDWQSSQPINTDLEVEQKGTQKDRRARNKTIYAKHTRNVTMVHWMHLSFYKGTGFIIKPVTVSVHSLYSHANRLIKSASPVLDSIMEYRRSNPNNGDPSMSKSDTGRHTHLKGRQVSKQAS